MSPRVPIHSKARGLTGAHLADTRDSGWRDRPHQLQGPWQALDSPDPGLRPAWPSQEVWSPQ